MNVEEIILVLEHALKSTEDDLRLMSKEPQIKVVAKSYSQGKQYGLETALRLIRG